MTTSYAGSEIMRRSGRPSLDYYLIAGEHSAEPEVILVEEFVLADDYSAVRLDSAGWTLHDRRWWGSAAVSRDIRVDATLRGRVVGVSRREAEAVYRRLGGRSLPDEETLRTYFHDGTPLATSAPLRLGSGRAAAGYHETRVYRILFANDLSRDGLAALGARWRMTITRDAADPQARVLGTARLSVGDDAFTWELRRIGTGTAWCVDLTANLAGSRDDAIGPLLRELTTTMREQVLIPVTIERFA